MLKITSFVILFGLIAAAPAPCPTATPVPTTSLAKVCAKISKVKNMELLFKGELSDHITNPTDTRQNGYTLVCGTKCPDAILNKSITAVYFSDGTRAAQVGYYGTFFGNGKARAYCGANGAPQCDVKEIAPQAKTIGRNGKLYLRMSKEKVGTNTLCVEVNSTGRTGDV